MQPQYSQGAAPSHHPPPYAPPEVSQTNGGSITSSLRQWRKKDYVEKQQTTEPPSTSANENTSHVARVAPHTYYPRPTNDLCHYQHQYAEYGVPYKPQAPTPVKYSEIVETQQQAQTIEHITPMIPKHKEKEYADLCSVAPQPHLKQYSDHLSLKQPYPESVKQSYSDPTVHHQYISKDPQMHPFLQKQTMHQYIQKEPYQQFLPPKYNMQGQYAQSYPSEPNHFLAHLNKINPRMAQSIMNDTHLRESQIPMYHNLDQNRSYPQPQRMYQAPPLHTSPTHAHRNISQAYNYSQPYNYNVKSNMQPSDPYNRVHQFQHNVPKYLSDYKMNEQPIPNISPQRVYNESVHMNYAPMPPKISPNYPPCSQLEYAQHYQHRRQISQEYYSHPTYKPGYVQNPQVSPDDGGIDARTQKSSLKQYLENWVDEEMSGNLPDIIVSNNLSDVETMENLKGTMCVKGSDGQEQPLYVLDTTEIPNENLPHFLHLQQFEKLPDNIRGYYHSANALPPNRRIIIDNSPEEPPENNQIIKGNFAPIVSKIPEVFSESAGTIVIEDDRIANKPMENQRKVVSESNLENKVVQIHIVEEPTATTNSEVPRESNTSETVIIQPNPPQHNPVQVKMAESDDNCVIKKSALEIDEENSSTLTSDTKANSVKSMPDIGDDLEETSQDKVIQSDNSDTDAQQKETCENTQKDEQLSICNIYKEMEHIHGENTANPKASDTLQQENSKPSVDSVNKTSPDQNTTATDLKMQEETPVAPLASAALNPNEEVTIPQVPEILDSALIEPECLTDLVGITNLEIPCCLSNDNETKTDVNLADEFTEIKEAFACGEDPPDAQTTPSNTEELHEKETDQAQLLEQTQKSDDITQEICAVAEEKIIEDNNNLGTDKPKRMPSKKKRKRRHSADGKINVDLPAKDKVRRNSAITSQSSDENPLPNKEEFTKQLQECSVRLIKTVIKTNKETSTDNEENMPKIVNQETNTEKNDAIDIAVATICAENEKTIDVPKVEDVDEKTEDALLPNIPTDLTINTDISEEPRKAEEPAVESTTTPLNLSIDKKPLQANISHEPSDDPTITRIISTQVDDICITEFIRSGLTESNEQTPTPLNMSKSVDPPKDPIELPKLSPKSNVEPFEFVDCIDNPNVELETTTDEPKLEDSLKLDNNLNKPESPKKIKKKPKTKTSVNKTEKAVKEKKRIHHHHPVPLLPGGVEVKKRNREKISEADIPRKSRRLSKHDEQQSNKSHDATKSVSGEKRKTTEDVSLNEKTVSDSVADENQQTEKEPTSQELEKVNKKTDRSSDSEDKEMPALEAEAPCNPGESFEETETSVVYQINDTNVVLQIADELLQINVTAHNGRKVILVKTFSDAIIMNTSEEHECPILEDQTAVHYEESKSEKQEQNEPVVENNCEDVADNPSVKTTEPADVTNFCMKEICDGSELTSVENDVCIYNEEVVSSSTEIETVPNTDDKKHDTNKTLHKKYATRKSKKEKIVPSSNELKIKCLTEVPQIILKDEGSKPKPEVPKEQNSLQKPTNIKDSLRKAPKTKAALKFVETTIKSSKTNIKDQKVPSKTVDQLKEDSCQKVSKSVKKRVKTDDNIKTAPKEKHPPEKSNKIISNHNHKIESHSNKNKVIENTAATNEITKTTEAPKPKEKLKTSEKRREVNPQKSHNLPSRRDEMKVRKPPKPIPKNQTKIDLLYKASIEPSYVPNLKTEFNIKGQKSKTDESVSILKGVTDLNNAKRDDIKMTEIAMNLTDSLIDEHVKPIKPEEKTQFIQETVIDSSEKLVSVQENSITSSTSQESEAVTKDPGCNKLIQQIADEWEDDSDDVKVTENACKRRLSLQEYNNRKRTNSTMEREITQQPDFDKTDLTNNLLDNVNAILSNKCKRDLSPDSPMLSVKFSNKTYSRSSSVYSVKDSLLSYKSNIDAKDTNVTPDYKKEETLSSAIELQLPKINRSHQKPTYTQEYIRNALLNDLNTVSAITTTLIKENQQLMQRFLEQQRLTAEELKTVKQIIRYKRLVQHLTNLKVNEVQSSNIRYDVDVNSSSNSAHLKLNESLHDLNKGQSLVNHIVNASENILKVSQPHTEEGIKVQFKKSNPERRKRKRFRFLYSDDETELSNSPSFSSTPLKSSETKLDKNCCLKRPRLDNSVPPTVDPKVMDYSVHQSNSQGQLTLVFKRSFKSDPRMQPFVKLERLSSIDQLARNKFH